MQDKRKQGERSMVKFPVIEFDLRKAEGKDDSKKKVKPLMIDAWTQTERSDYAIIKSRLQLAGAAGLVNTSAAATKETAAALQIMQKHHSLDNGPAQSMRFKKPMDS